MTDETIGTVEAHEVILERCPTGCGNWKRATLPMKWEQDVEHGFAIPIVGCGNPWHYTNLAAAPMTDETTRLRDARDEAVYRALLMLMGDTPRPLAPRELVRLLEQDGYTITTLTAAEARAGLVSVEALESWLGVFTEGDPWMEDHTCIGCGRRQYRVEPPLANGHREDCAWVAAREYLRNRPALAATPPAPAVERCGYLIRMLGLTPFICNRAEDDALHRSRTHPDAHSFLTATHTPERLLDAIEAAR